MMNQYVVLIQDDWEQDNNPSQAVVDASNHDEAMAQAMKIVFPNYQYNIVSQDRDDDSASFSLMVSNNNEPLDVYVWVL